MPLPEIISNILEQFHSNPPTTIEDFHQFVLIGKEELEIHKGKIMSMENTGEVRAAKEAAVEDAQGIAECVLLAEAKLGELLMNIKRQYVSPTVGSPKGTDGNIPKQLKTLPSGITKKDSHIAQQIAKNPEIVQRVIENAREKKEIPTVHKVLQEIKRAAIEKRHQSLRSQPFPEGKYGVILADPAWSYDNSGYRLSAQSHYPTMTTEQICALDVASLCTDSSILFLWATNPLLPEALQVMGAWGFRYATNIAWIKKGIQGIGWYLKSCHELLLIGVRQNTPHPRERFDSFFETTRGLGHSKKPDKAYEIIESMYPCNKIELFARSRRDGWDSWGNEC